MKILNRLLIILFIPLTIFSWGDKGHKKITELAFKMLPAEIGFTEAAKKEIIARSVDPDYRKKEDPSEPNKHFIDIDFYKEFLDGQMIKSHDSLLTIYPDSIVTKMGMLPWATLNTFDKLVGAFKSKDIGKITLYVFDLAHYVGDGHQPLHTTLNYNGQLTSQKGIHFRYEIEMFDKNINLFDEKFLEMEPVYVNNKLDYIFDYITESNSFVDVILSADKFAYKKSKNVFDDEYYRLLWFRAKYLTIDQVNSSAFALASLIYTAWLDSGKP